MDAIAEEYKKSTGLHGKPRQFSADANRARVSVKKAIDFAIRQIKQQSPGLSDHFQKYVSTGSSLTYRDTTIPWTTA
jgi:hypothetical protein